MSTTSKLSLPLDTLGKVPFANSFKDAMAILDDAVGGVLTGSATYDPASLADGAAASTTVTVTGAALGDIVTGVSFSLDLQGVDLTAYVSAADTVTVKFANRTGGTLDLGEGDIAIVLRQG